MTLKNKKVTTIDKIELQFNKFQLTLKFSNAQNFISSH